MRKEFAHSICVCRNPYVPTLMRTLYRCVHSYFICTFPHRCTHSYIRKWNAHIPYAFLTHSLRIPYRAGDLLAKDVGIRSVHSYTPNVQCRIGMYIRHARIFPAPHPANDLLPLTSIHPSPLDSSRRTPLSLATFVLDPSLLYP